MFEALGRKLEGAFKRLTGQHKISEDNIKEALREVRLALLEADVNYKVVKDFVQAVQERALGQEVLRGVDPAQQFIHIVYIELVRMLGGKVREVPPAEGEAETEAASESESGPAPGEGGSLAVPEAKPTSPVEPGLEEALEAAEGGVATLAEPEAAASPAPAPAPPILGPGQIEIQVERPFAIEPGRSSLILMLGLQGSGKTTFCGKLARRLVKMKCRPLLVACDIYRPAAIEQLHVVARSVGVPSFDLGTDKTPVEIIRAAQEKAREQGNDVLIVDTAGRLHIDEVKMDELQAIKEETQPDYTFLVCDAMTGQDAVTSASTFNDEVGIDGVCMTKMDGDARGGASLSVRAVTGKPIVFAGTGERPEDLEEFLPDRVASRILGMGDVVSLVEKAQEAIDAEQALEMQEKIRERKFDFNDFVKQMRTVKKMGPLKGLLGMIPGMGKMLGEVDNDQLEGELKHVEAIIGSMTPSERADDELLRKSGPRRMRVAKGSGSSLQEVTELIRQFDQAKTMMQMMLGGGGGALGGLKNMLTGQGLPQMPPGAGGMPGLPPGMPGVPSGMGGGKRSKGRSHGGVYMKRKKKKKRKGR